MHVNVIKDFKEMRYFAIYALNAQSITLHLFQDVRNMSTFLKSYKRLQRNALVCYFLGP